MGSYSSVILNFNTKNMYSRSLLLLGFASAAIVSKPSAEGDSEWVQGQYGDLVECSAYKPGSVATGVCGSGNVADCDSGAAAFKLKCTETKSLTEVSNCRTFTSPSGGWVQCPWNYIVVGGCGSGLLFDCSSTGVYVVNEVQCCQKTDITVDPNAGCSIIRGVRGEDIECPANNVIIAMCGSGSLANCNTDPFF